MKDLIPIVDLLMNEASHVRRPRDDTKDGRAIDRIARDERKHASVRQLNLRETDDRRVERSEVEVKAATDAARAIGTKIHNAAEYGCLRGEKKSIATVDGIESVGANGCAYAHGKRLIGFDGERGASRNHVRSGPGHRRACLAHLRVAKERY